jgi:hypothetical protein
MSDPLLRQKFSFHVDELLVSPIDDGLCYAAQPPFLVLKNSTPLYLMPKNASRQAELQQMQELNVMCRVNCYET